MTSGQPAAGTPGHAPSASGGRARSSAAQWSMLRRTLRPVKMMPTCGSPEDSRPRPACMSESAMWCSVRTRREMRETSMRRMKASSWSEGRCGEARERPRERLGMTDTLKGDCECGEARLVKE